MKTKLVRLAMISMCGLFLFVAPAAATLPDPLPVIKTIKTIKPVISPTLPDPLPIRR